MGRWICVECREPLGVIVRKSVLITGSGADAVTRTTTEAAWRVRCARCQAEKLFSGHQVVMSGNVLNSEQPATMVVNSATE